MTFRTRLFLTSTAAAAVTLLVATLLFSWWIRRSVGDRIQRALVSDAKLAAETLSHRRSATPAVSQLSEAQRVVFDAKHRVESAVESSKEEIAH